MTEISQATNAIAPTPQNTDKDPIYSIHIKGIDHGYVVEVGCKCFAIENTDKLIDLLGNYLKDPIGTERQYRSGTLFQKQTV